MTSLSYPASSITSTTLSYRSQQLEINEGRTHLGITILRSVPVAAFATTGRRSLSSGRWSGC